MLRLIRHLFISGSDMRMQRNTGFVGAILALMLLAIPAIATLFDIFTGPDSPRAEGIARTPVLESGIGQLCCGHSLLHQTALCSQRPVHRP